MKGTERSLVRLWFKVLKLVSKHAMIFWLNNNL
jgi:hypothetical protein